MDDEIYYNDRQVFTAIAGALKEISKTLKELTGVSQRGLTLSQKCDIIEVDNLNEKDKS